jgi:RNA polymerase sigma factor (sigma-70 family)
VNIMRVFVAGGTGVVGRRLVPQLVARGHQVTATTTDPAKLGSLEQLGAEAVVMDGLDAASVGEAVATARPDAIVHQMTAISEKVDLKHMDRWFATTNRLRTEGTDHLLAAAEATGVPHVVAQSYASWNGIRQGGWVKTEEDPLDMHAGTPAEPVMAAAQHVEDVVVKAGGAALRFGWLYGPGAMESLVGPVLGSVSEAEDAVQETWLRFSAASTQPRSTKAYLSAVVTRISIDVLRSARLRREEYVGPWFPEPLLADPYEDPARSAELADSVSTAALLLLERLSPLERAVFVLREVFGFSFPEIATAVGRSEAACRQLAVRARRHMDGGALVSRPTRGSGSNSPSGSSTPSGTVTSRGCRICSPPTLSWSATAEARHPGGARASSVPRTSPGCSPRCTRRSPRSASSWSHTR